MARDSSDRRRWQRRVPVAETRLRLAGGPDAGQQAEPCRRSAAGKDGWPSSLRWDGRRPLGPESRVTDESPRAAGPGGRHDSESVFQLAKCKIELTSMRYCR